MFTYSEKAVKKLIENFECYGDKLHEDVVYEAFNTIMVQARKAVKNDTKLSVDELNEKIEAARAKGVEDDTANKRAKAATKKVTKPASTQSRRKSTRRVVEEESSEEEEEPPKS